MNSKINKILGQGSNFIRRIPLIVSSLRRIYRRGGYASYSIALVSYGNRLNGKRILVTGGGSGIGLAIAKKCLSEGALVLITGRNLQKLEVVRRELDDPNLKLMQWDVSATSDLADQVEKATLQLEGEIDILVNNAGVLSTLAFPNVTEDVWDHVYSINSRGLFFLTQMLCKRMMQLGRTGKIINISSQGGFVGATYPYRMTKWDVAGFTQGLGLKMAPHGIIVNGIAPGIVATDMQKECLREPDNIFSSLTPVGRFALPDEIAELAAFLMSDASNFIVGQTILCDGGFSYK